MNFLNIIFAKLDITGADNLRQRKVRTQVQFIERILVIFTCTISASLILMSFEGGRETLPTLSTFAVW
jgi:hypothetical protein